MEYCQNFQGDTSISAGPELVKLGAELIKQLLPLKFKSKRETPHYTGQMHWENPAPRALNTSDGGLESHLRQV